MLLVVEPSRAHLLARTIQTSRLADARANKNAACSHCLNRRQERQLFCTPLPPPPAAARRRGRRRSYERRLPAV